MASARPRVPGIDCPHCNQRAIARSSVAVTPLYRTLYFRCSNEECGHGFHASLAILHSVRPSMTPNPDVQLPLRLAATLKPVASLPANDSEPATITLLLSELENTP